MKWKIRTEAKGLALLGLCAGLLCAGSAQAQAPAPGKNMVSIRGRQQEIYFLRGQGPAPHCKVIYAPGDGGWRGFGVTIAEQIAAAGCDVYGLNTRTYLSSFTSGSSGLAPADIARDYRQIADWARQGSGAPVILAGWSEGAGLGLAAAAEPSNRGVFCGLVAIGMTEVNILAWHWSDFGAEIAKEVPHEPTFASGEYIAKVAPMPLFMIASTNDEYVSQEETRKLFAAAQEPKRLRLVRGDDHKYGGNADEFFRTLRDALSWVTHPKP